MTFKSSSLTPTLAVKNTEEAIFAAGCFWGVEYYFKKCPGVLQAESGYTGGHKNNPIYEEICEGNTGHFEAVRVIYDPAKISYKQLAQYFFEIHDPTQKNGQGPDLGEQYKSAAFYYNDKQKQIIEELIQLLKAKGQPVATQVLAVSPFWPAEAYHQNYYAKTGKEPYCHHYVKKF